MPTKPLSYDSLKTVLQYIEANLRFQVSLHIPSIRVAERAVPLKINYLSFDGLKIVVNKTEYKFGVYRKYRDDTSHVSRYIQFNNGDGGVQHELDQYGLRNKFFDEILTPGDVDIGKSVRERQLIFHRSHKVQMQDLGMEVEQLEEIVDRARLQNKKFVETRWPGFENEGGAEPDGMDVDEDLPNQQIDNVQDEALEQALNGQHDDLNMQQVEDDHLIVGPQGQDILNQENNGHAGPGWLFPRGTSVAYVESLLKDKREQLFLYHCWRDNRQSPLEMFIQFTITSKSGKHIQRMVYNKKLYEAQKHLNSFLFGKRLYPIQADGLYIDGWTILRLPLGMKLKIKRLRIPCYILGNFEPLEPVFEASSFPLRLLNIEIFHHDDADFGHTIVRNAKKLLIWSYASAPWSTILQSLTNQRVDLKIDCLENDDYINLIQNWLDTSRPIKTSFSFVLNKKEEDMAELLELIKQRFNVTISKRRSVTLSMKDYLHLKVNFKADPHSKNLHEEPQWVLKMRVFRYEAE